VWPRSVLRAFQGLAEPPQRLGPARLVADSPPRPCFPRASPAPVPLQDHPQRKWLGPECSCVRTDYVYNPRSGGAGSQEPNGRQRQGGGASLIRVVHM